MPKTDVEVTKCCGPERRPLNGCGKRRKTSCRGPLRKVRRRSQTNSSSRLGGSSNLSSPVVTAAYDPLVRRALNLVLDPELSPWQATWVSGLLGRRWLTTSWVIPVVIGLLRPVCGIFVLRCVADPPWTVADTMPTRRAGHGRVATPQSEGPVTIGRWAVAETEQRLVLRARSWEHRTHHRISGWSGSTRGGRFRPVR